MNLQQIENSALGFLGNLSTVDSRQIRKAVRILVEGFPPESVLDIEACIEDIAKRIEEKLDLTMADASTVKLPFEPWLPSRRATTDEYYWNRYREYLKQGGFAPRILGTLDKDTDRIVGLLEDPSKQVSWRRRGLVVGHVQSGKTANYVGVITKAADHGYKFIVLLAGTQNNLRRQTQERIEEGFIGIDSDRGGVADRPGAQSMWTGVGKLDHSRRPISITSKRYDFRTNIANASGISFSSVKEPIILVIKKQKRVLENLIDWLSVNNRAREGVIQGIPMLLVDDEADNASINTNDQTDPTQINFLIRKLLEKFDQNCYLGITATPFANIFIDPDSHQEMVKEDLFPRDFIVSLDAPSDYAGASRIFNPTGDLASMIREVDDHIEILPEKHKISYQLEELPASLVRAIDCFILARAIRILRGRGTDHNSMLVNVSRFNAIQVQVSALISDYITRLRMAIQGHASLKPKQALREPLLGSLYESWKQEFESVSPDWDEIQSVLLPAIGPITIKVINNKSADILDYKAEKSTGLHVIAVGGLGLSRGFTLEGLTTSYFLRNSIMYDTLLQMGRWFGYRKGYEDLCRLFMTVEAVDWYSHISDALDELRDEFRRMERQHAKPEDFGLKVRAHPASLIVTARNKMRTGKKVFHSVSLDGQLIETAALRADKIQWNWRLLDEFIKKLDGTNSIHRANIDKGLLWRSVPVSYIKDFLNGFRNDDDNSPGTQVSPVSAYLDLLAARAVDKWDVCLYSPSKGEVGPEQIAGHTIQKAKRRCLSRSGAYLVSGTARRVASRGSESVGLTHEEIAKANSDFERKYGKDKNISDRYFRENRSFPLLMLHALQLEVDNEPREPKAMAWGISFPRKGIEGELVQYVVNTTWWQERYSQEQEEGDEDVDA